MEVKLEGNTTAIKNMEVQIGQMASTLNIMQKGKFPSDTEVNPREHCKAVTLRSGKELQEPEKKKMEEPVITTEERENKEEVVKEATPTLQADKPTSSIASSLPNSLPYPQHALEQMPNYVRFMKDIMTGKRKLEAYETVNLTEEGSAILQRKLPHKLKDPGSFTIPCTIGSSSFNKALCDLGANFVVLDMEEDSKIPKILGRPFLVTGRAMIDVQLGKLTLRVNEEVVVFDISRAMKYPKEVSTCDMIDVVDATVAEIRSFVLFVDALEKCMLGSDIEEIGELDQEVSFYHDALN
ncbi:uncharacterized protein LOC111025551 [Momordica charantia]|uniref:Uncharacterized protein LOC111025551 n=1 Tax=Momordica charantia TaxID=3673 RepID=A0A6J1E1F6_MOMCH|nr:uncharacterized protein LOC111025551 [Momordica charantia]